MKNRRARLDTLWRHHTSCSAGLLVRSSPFQGDQTGSIPVQNATTHYYFTGACARAQLRLASKARRGRHPDAPASINRGLVQLEEHRILIPTVARSNRASPATTSLQRRISSAVEHRIVYPAVGGSIPPCVANLSLHRWRNRQTRCFQKADFSRFESEAMHHTK